MLSRPKTFLIPVLAAGLLATSANAAQVRTTQAAVRLVPTATTVHAGTDLAVMLVNNSDAKVAAGYCITLQRFSHGTWTTITRTHGLTVGCPSTEVLYPTVIPGRSQHSVVSAPLYDDLVPGTYRITLPYRPATSSSVQAPISTKTELATTSLKVEAYHPGPEPHLSKASILKLALTAATADGDAKPTLVQSAENTEFQDGLVNGGDFTYNWTFAYLITIHGHFTAGSVPLPKDATAPTGNVITLEIAARTGDQVSAGLGDSVPDLSKLGTVTTELG